MARYVTVGGGGIGHQCWSNREGVTARRRSTRKRRRHDANTGLVGSAIHERYFVDGRLLPDTRQIQKPLTQRRRIGLIC